MVVRTGLEYITFHVPVRLDKEAVTGTAMVRLLIEEITVLVLATPLLFEHCEEYTHYPRPSG